MSSSKKFAPSDISEAVVHIPVDLIIPNRFQPRLVFDQKKLQELSNSIKEKGVMQPVVVREIKDENINENYELIFGERRWRGTKMAGLTHIPAIVRNKADRESRVDALVENINREDLIFAEKMNSLVNLKEDLGSISEVARETSLTEKTIQRYLKIHREITKSEEIHQLFIKQATEIDFSTAKGFSDVIDNILRLRKADRREYQRILNRLEKKGIKNSVQYLRNRFLNNREELMKIEPKPFFRETDRELILHISHDKTSDVTQEKLEHIRKSVNSFIAALERNPAEATKDALELTI